jgi:hypothetical protein
VTRQTTRLLRNAKSRRETKNVVSAMLNASGACAAPEVHTTRGLHANQQQPWQNSSVVESAQSLQDYQSLTKQHLLLLLLLLLTNMQGTEYAAVMRQHCWQ